MPYINDSFHTDWASLWTSELELTLLLQKNIGSPALTRSAYVCSDNHKEHLHHLMRYQKHQPEF